MDTQIADESFLEDINNILSSGEVPNLYKSDEFEEVWLPSVLSWFIGFPNKPPASQRFHICFSSTPISQISVCEAEGMLLCQSSPPGPHG